MKLFRRLNKGAAGLARLQVWGAGFGGGGVGCAAVGSSAFVSVSQHVGVPAAGFKVLGRVATLLLGQQQSHKMYLLWCMVFFKDSQCVCVSVFRQTG